MKETLSAAEHGRMVGCSPSRLSCELREQGIRADATKEIHQILTANSVAEKSLSGPIGRA